MTPISNVARLSAALSLTYRVDRELGAGGMATVYLAHDLKHERDVAIKVLHPDLGAALGAERFLSEIKTTAKLQHPHILPLLDSGAADGLLYYVMPFVDGETLRARLERETQLPIADAVQLAREVADALQYAHDRGIIHRDIKPENILLQGAPGNQHALVADFGIALAVQQAGGQRITQTGLSLGTPQYMSPEQATGEKTIDARADLYALGAVTYEMLVGEPPFTGPSTQAIVARLLTNSPAPLRDTRATVPEHIEAAVLTALAKLPADRQANVTELSAQLRGTVTTAPPVVSSRARTVETPRRLRLALALTTLVAIGASVLAGWLATRPAPSVIPRTLTVQLPETAQVSERAAYRRVALSRDGRRLYYVGASAGGYAIYVRDAEDTMPRQLSGTVRGGAPVPCPDGRSLYFTSANTTAMRVSADGAAPTQVLDSAVVTDCDARGSLLFTRARGIWLLENGGQARLIASPDSAQGEVLAGSASFLPGGTHLVMFTSRTGEQGTGHLSVVALENGTREDLDVQGRGVRYSQQHLLYTNEGSLYALPFDARSRRKTGAPVLIATSVATRPQATDFDVSDDGTLVYLSGSLGGMYSLSRVDRSGREQRLDRDANLYSWPRVAPDGNRVAVEIGGIRGGYDVWLFTIGNQSLERLTSNFSGVRPLGWSADGRRVAYLAMDYPGSPRQRRTLAWIPADQSAPPQRVEVRIPDSSRVEDATIYRGMDLIGIRTGGYGRPGDLWVASAPADTTQHWTARPFLVTPADEETPRLSPDGRWMAYTSNETGVYEVYVRPSSGTGGRVAISAGPGAEPVWARDGSGLFYRGVNRMLFVTLREGQTPAVVRRDTLFADVYRKETLSIGYDVFPDGRSLLMQKPSGSISRQPVMILNWPALLSR